MVPEVRTAISPACFPLCPTYVWVSKTVVGKVPTLASGVALGSPPLGLHEDSQPLAASPWPDNSVLENKLKYEVGRDGAHGELQRHGALQDGRRLTWRSICSLQLRKKPTSAPRVTIWISVEFLDPGVRSRGGVEADPRQTQRPCRLLGGRVACHGTSMLTLTFHVCVELKRNPHRNKFRNWFLQFLGVQQRPPFTSTSQSTVTPRHPTTVLFKNNSAHPQQGLDRGRAIPWRVRMHKKDSRTLSEKNTTKTGGSVRCTPPKPLLRYERSCILQDGRTRWRISQLSRPKKR